MALTRSDWIAHLSVLVIVVSLAMIGVELTGHATDTGTVNITIVSSAAINFTVDNINFGTGTVTSGQTSATLDSEGNVTNGNWSAVSQGFELVNIGNINVTLNISSDKNAANFIGGSSPQFNYKITNHAAETGSCTGNGASSYTALTGSLQPGCTTFGYLDANDHIDLDIQLVVPYDASGTKGAVITANATAQ